VLLVAIALAAYLASFGLGVAFDAANLLDDPRLQSFTSENLSRILTGPYWYGNFQAGLYRPLTTLSLLVNYSILGNGVNPAGYHVVNFLLHTTNVCLVFWLLRRLFDSQWPAFFAAALWAVHPVGVETVANVAGRADLLSTLAVLGALLCYARRVHPAWVLAIALPGMFAKESTAALLGLMLLWDCTRGLEEFRADWPRRAATYAAVAAAVVFLFAVRAHQPPMLVPLVDNPMAGVDFVTARLTAIAVIGRYLALLIFPLTLSADYSYNAVPVAQLGSPATLLSLAVVVAILATVLMRYRRDRVLFFAAGFFAIALLPASNLLAIIGSIMAERFLYMPSIGFAVAVVALLYRLETRFGRPHLARAIVLVLLAAFGLRSFARTLDWKDDLTLWTADIASTPNSCKVQKGYATALFDRDARRNLDVATAHLERAWSIVGRLPAADLPVNVMGDLGTCYRMKGDRAGGQNTPQGRAWYNRAVATLLRARESDRAASLLRRQEAQRKGFTLEGIPGDPTLYHNLANTLLNLKRFPEALDACRYWRILQPRNPDAFLSAAAVHMAAGNQEGAARVLLQEMLLGVPDPDVEAKLENVYRQLPGGDCMFVKSGSGLALNPSCPRLQGELCAAEAELVPVLTEAGKIQEAEAQRNTALTRYGCN
jgi:protein O-mannosyl-transferase